ncbi:MAG: hypothetical protein Q8L48_22705 [Archangium sp.]|nr:hypothetical protein [Archangium sp.]
MFLALTLWVASALPVAEVPRPGGPITDPAAQVLVTENAVTIDPGGGQKPFTALNGMLLLRNDLVVVGPGAWVALVILGNEHVVRLDDDLALRVSDLALLNAPKQTRSPVQQLDTLLTRQERQRTERLIGWHASQTAANTQPVKAAPREEASKAKVKLQAAESQKRNDDDLIERDAPQKEVAPAPSPPPPGMGPATGGGSNARPSPKPASPMPPSVDAELSACVESAVSAWGAEVKAKLGKSVLVSAKLRDGEVVVRLPLGLPAPACAAAYFKQRGLSASWTNVAVPLK